MGFEPEEGPGGGSLSPTPITYANLLTLYNAGTMTPGWYIITDQADAGIVIEAVSSSQLAVFATGLFLNPDFQSVGDYSGAVGLTTVPYTSTQGVWYAALEATLVDGDVVFWDGLHYQVINALAFQGLNPASSPGFLGPCYQVLPKATANVGYITEADDIEYDFVNASIFRRSDKRGNKVAFNGRLFFQWGNDSVAFNTIDDLARWTCYNSRGTISYNKAYAGVLITTGNTTSGTITYNEFDGMKGTTGGSLTVNTTGSFSGCLVRSNQAHTFDIATNYDSCTLQKDFSDFPATANVDTATTIAMASISYAGIVNMTSGNATESITTITGMPIDHPVQFVPESNLAVMFVHATGANQPRCEGGVNAVVDGATGDWVEFTSRETNPGSAVFRAFQTNIGTY